jgi:hypothetical protein
MVGVKYEARLLVASAKSQMKLDKQPLSTTKLLTKSLNLHLHGVCVSPEFPRYLEVNQLCRDSFRDDFDLC